MESKFKDIIEANFSFIKEEKFLLAVSGGVDSMVMLHLCSRLHLNFEVAHCNYQLRGDASDADEALVQHTCAQLNKPVHVKKFDLGQPTHSIQTTARTLRYKWFEELLKETNASYIMLAHHLNDQLETMLINLSRTTGIDGLRGMLPIQNKRIRPLLGFEKKEIIAFAKSENISWREDQSNSKEDYKRNFIRHRIAPLMEELHPNFWQNLDSSIQLLQTQSNNLNDWYKAERHAIKRHTDHWQIEIAKISEWEVRHIIVPVLAPFGVQASLQEAISTLISAENGKKIETSSHVFIKLDQWVYIHPLQQHRHSITIEEMGSYQLGELHVELKEFPGNSFDPSKRTIQLDRDKVQFPLTIRNIEDGDRFQPFGMKGNKLVNDYLKDRKVNKVVRENTFVVISEENLIAILDHTVNEQFKIDINTKYILEIGTFVESST